MIALCIGHSRPGDRGAVSVEDVTEHDFWKLLAPAVVAGMADRGCAGLVFSRYEGKSYGAAMTWLAEQVKESGAALAVELHFNSSATRAASGHEWLYWMGSGGGLAIAKCLDRAMRKNFPDRLPRGCKERGPQDRGSSFLSRVPCPAVIAEPFFGTSRDDWAAVAGKPALLAETLAAGLAEAHAILTKPPTR